MKYRGESLFLEDFTENESPINTENNTIIPKIGTQIKRYKLVENFEIMKKLTKINKNETITTMLL